MVTQFMMRADGLSSTVRTVTAPSEKEIT